jgi:hypothetical protein
LLGYQEWAAADGTAMERRRSPPAARIATDRVSRAALAAFCVHIGAPRAFDTLPRPSAA